MKWFNRFEELCYKAVQWECVIFFDWQSFRHDKTKTKANHEDNRKLYSELKYRMVDITSSDEA